MKKLIVSGLAALMSLTSAMAQEETGVGNHLAWGVGFGTEGFNVSIATDMTKYAELEFGANFAPGFKYSGVGNAHFTTMSGNNRSSDIDMKAKMARATLDFKGSVYPFADSNDLFFTAGLSFASKELVDIDGTCIEGDPNKQNPYVKVGKYKLPLDNNGDGSYTAKATANVNSVRPYVGIGYGRLVPKKNLGFRAELGCQFQGSVKVFKNEKEAQLLSDEGIKDDRDVKKVMDFFSIYPVLKVSLRGKFF